jgi:hypothetical protein
MHRPLAALALLVGCSSEPNTIVLVVERETSVADSTAPDTAAPDTAVADTGRADTGSPIVDTGTPAQDTTAPCVPTTKENACAGFSWMPYCGLRDDGCGGKIQCDPCASSYCVRGGTYDAGHYVDDTHGVCGRTCRPWLPWTACRDSAGVEGDRFDCDKSYVPVSPKCSPLLYPSRDAPAGSTGWCCPLSGSEW